MGDRDTGLRRASAVTVGLAAASAAGVLVIAVGVAAERARASDSGGAGATGPVSEDTSTGGSTDRTGSQNSTGWPPILGGQGRQHASSGGS